MKIGLLYFEACPSYKETASNLSSGSPTILINGKDLEEKSGDYFYGCRVYFINGKVTGSPNKTYLKEKLKPFLQLF